MFAQAHIIPAKPTTDEKRMHLVAKRQTKVLFKPVPMLADCEPVAITVSDRNGQLLGSMDMKPPHQLAQNVQAIQEIKDTNIDFSFNAQAAFDISEMTNQAISNALAQHDVVRLTTYNGRWVSKLSLEQNNPALDGKTFVFVSNAALNTQVSYYQFNEKTIVQGATSVFKNVQGTWVVEEDLLFNKLSYGEGFWSANLPKEWIQPGIKLTFKQAEKVGSFASFEVGAATELLIHTIDIGMLVEPRDEYDFQLDDNAHREYFETAPISKLTVSKYEPLHLTEVVLPDGTLLNGYDPSEGGWHTGTMRELIGKELISLGINNANYGIHSTAQRENPYLAAQLTAHNSQGRYRNGVQVHGGSGGAGMVTLDSSIGNEFSHEVGHNFGLGHFVGNFEGSVHRPANMTNSTWGWDSAMDVFIPNFSPTKTAKPTCVDGQCVEAFNGMFQFGKDAMAGGSPNYGKQRFTMYSPYSMQIAQQYFESKIVFDPSSATGFRKWDVNTKTMAEYEHRIEVLESTNVNPANANAANIAELFTRVDKVMLETRDGYWARDISLPAASAANNGKVFTFKADAGYSSTLTVNGQMVTVVKGDNLTYVSNGIRWQQGAVDSASVVRRPQAYGVPVTTLVGFYDPQGVLPSYIYPAMHGSYGYTYADDGSQSNYRCVLRVETKSGDIYTYKLPGNRHDAGRMNKFHVNIAQSKLPRFATVACSGETLNRRELTAPSVILNYTQTPSVGIKNRTAVRDFRQVVSAPEERVSPVPYEPAQCDQHDNTHDHNH